jgi:hypothetical protein
MNVIQDSNHITGRYHDLYNGLTCIVGEEIIRLVQCEVTKGEFPWLRNIICAIPLHIGA